MAVARARAQVARQEAASLAVHTPQQAQLAGPGAGGRRVCFAPSESLCTVRMI